MISAVICIQLLLIPIHGLILIGMIRERKRNYQIMLRIWHYKKNRRV